MSYAQIVTIGDPKKMFLAFRQDCPHCGTRDGLRMLTNEEVAELVDDGPEDFWTIDVTGGRPRINQRLFIKWFCFEEDHVMPQHYRRATPREVARCSARADVEVVVIDPLDALLI